MRKCSVTQRSPATGRSYTIRGIAKKKKGIGLKITGKNKRRFLPNIFSKRFWLPEENRFVRLKLSAAGIREITKKGISVVVRRMRKEGQKV